MWLPNWLKKRRVVPSPSTPRLRILAHARHASIRRLSIAIDDCVSLRWLAQQHKWELRLTQSPREAFNLASQSHFEIILCDRNQPGYPWREVMERPARCWQKSAI